MSSRQPQDRQWDSAQLWTSVTVFRFSCCCCCSNVGCSTVWYHDLLAADYKLGHIQRTLGSGLLAFLTCVSLEATQEMETT